MSNIHEKSIQICTTFDEMIARWEHVGLYSSYMAKKGAMTDLELLKKIELFFNDLEALKTELFVKRGSFTRNTEAGIGIYTAPKNLYAPTQYAKKWFPYAFLFEPLSFRSLINEYVVLEVSSRFRYFYEFYSYNLLEINIVNDQVTVSTAKRDCTEVFKFKTAKQMLLGITDISSLDTFYIELLNNMVKDYKELIKLGRKHKNLDSAFNKKRNDYISYVKELLDEYGSLRVFSMNFYLDKSSQFFDHAQVKSQFFNKIRFINDLNIIIGYFGSWEYSHLDGFFFRVVFFVPKNKIQDIRSLIDSMIYHWEVQSDVSKDKELSKIKFTAEPCPISFSNKSLKDIQCVLVSDKTKLFDDFVNSVINYTTLADKYFFPAELQIFIFEHMAKEKKKKNEKNQYLVENMQYSFSRSFKGQTRNRKN